MNKMDSVYMSMASLMAGISHGERLKVGAVLVTQNGVVLTGVNGLPKQLGNILEEIEYNDGGELSPDYPFEDEYGGDYKLTTRADVIHSELNCILKAAREGVSVVGGVLYVTHAPCPVCAAMLLQAGISKVAYKHNYRDMSGVGTLRQLIEVEQYSNE